MPELYPIQESFAYGVISPRLWNRPSTDRYQQAVAYACNMLPVSHGPMQLRNGSQFISPIDEIDHDLVLVPFQYTATESGVIVLGEQWVQVYGESGPLTHTPEGIELVENGTFTNGIAGWGEYSGHGSSGIEWDPIEEAMTVSSGGGQGNRYAGGFQLIQLQDTTGVAHELKWDADVLDGIGVVGEVRVGTSLAGSEIASFDLNQGSGQQQVFTPGAGVTEVYVMFYLPPGGDSVNIDNVSLKKQTGTPVYARWASPYAGYTRQLVQWDRLPNADELWIVHPNVRPYRLTFDGVTFNFEAISFTSPPADWSGESWPAAVTFHQQRSWFGGAPTSRETIRSSQTGDYTNLSVGTAQPDEAMEYTLERRGRISWLQGARALVVGTETAEYVAESQGVALIPGDINFRQQSGYGSVAGQTESIGDRVLYASGDLTKLRTMAYEWTKDAWISVDLAWPAEHLTRNQIERLAYGHEPEALVLMTERRTPHRMLACSYNREQNIIGWSEHKTDGEYHGVAVTTWAGSSLLWTAVMREIDGETQVYLERWGDGLPLDSYAEVTLDGARSTGIEGFDHLEGKEVGVIFRTKNGAAVHPPVTVVDGKIDLQYETDHVVVGLPYRGVALTLPVASQGNSLSNVASRRKRWNKVYLRTDGGVKPLVEAVDFFDTYRRLLDGEDPLSILGTQSRAERFPATPMGDGQPGRFEDIQVMGRGWSTAHGLLIVQDVYLPTSIVGLFGEMGVGTMDDRG